MSVTTLNETKVSRLLVTGASGFVGSALVRCLQRSGRHAVRSVVRGRYRESLPDGSCVVVGDLTAQTDWGLALVDIDVVIHVAARTQVVGGPLAALLAQFRDVNTLATLHLAEQASRAGVRRFVFISSIKVLGEASKADLPLTEEMPYAPADAYGISKMEAELGLLRLAKETGMEVVIVRPPLVYGPGMQSNFGALMQAVRSGLPLPFASIQNRRSFVAIDNLVDFIATCTEHPLAGDQIFAVSDGEDLSTCDLVRGMAKVLGRKPLLWPMPVVWLQFVASILGKQSIFQRLCGNLQIDISKARQRLGWTPRVTVQEGLQRVFKSERTS